MKFIEYSKINYGCGYDHREGYLNIDSDPLCKPNFLISPGDFSAIPKNHFVELLAKDVLEHIPRAKTLDALLDFSSLLKDSALLIVETSSILHIAKKLEEEPSFANQYGWTICMFGNQVHAGDFHFTGFTDTTLTVYLEAAGFSVEKKDLLEGWLLRYECRKESAWDQILLHDMDDLVFLNNAYQSSFNRPVDETGIAYFGEKLASGVDRRLVLKEIYTSPERLFMVAKNIGR
jgi:hypothetical protein